MKAQSCVIYSCLVTLSFKWVVYMWAQHLQVWEVYSSQCASLSLITKATDLLIKPLLFPCCIDTVAFHKYKMFPSLHEDASCCYTEHLKHLIRPGQKRWRGGGNGMQLQTQLGPLGAPGSFTEGGGTAKGNEAVKGGWREGEGGACVYILKQRGCLLSLAADPTCRWSTQSPGRSKSQGPGWTSLWNGNGA